MRESTESSAGPAAGTPGVRDIRPGLLLLACLLLSTSVRSPRGLPADATPDLAAVLAAMAALLATVVALARRTPLLAPGRWVGRLTTTCWSGLLVFSAVFALAFWVRWLIQRGSSDGVALAVGVGMTLLLLVVAVLVLLRHWRWAVLLATVYLAATSGLVHLVPTDIDVLIFERDAAAALLRGDNPYAMTFDNPYSPEESSLYYGPGVAEGGRILLGYPYPPVSLLLVLPGALLGDVRLAMCVAIGITAALLYRNGRDTFSRQAALFLLLLPGVPYIFAFAWIEPLVVALLAATVVGAQRGWRAAPYLLGAFLVSKQYLVVIAPLLWLLRPAARRHRGGVIGVLARVAVAGALLMVPFLLWSPAAFWDSLVEFQLMQPFRSDSFSLLAWSVVHTGWPPESVYGWLPLVGGGLTALVLAWRAPRTPSAFAATTSATMVVTMMLSKQAFANYFFLAAGALLVAACTWRGDPGNGSAEREVGHTARVE